MIFFFFGGGGGRGHILGDPGTDSGEEEKVEPGGKIFQIFSRPF